jgi:hypothetical protein
LTNLNNQLTVWGDKNTPLWKKIFYGAEGYAELAKEISDRNKLIASGLPAGPGQLAQPWVEAQNKAAASTVNLTEKVKELKKEIAPFMSKANIDFEKSIIPNATNVLTASAPGAMPDKASPGASLTQYVQSIKEAAQATKSFIDVGGMLSGTLSQIAFGFGQAMAGGKDFGKVILQAIGGFMRSFGEALIAIGTASLKLRFAISNPIAAIAAGVALVALSGAIAGSASRSLNNMGGGGGGSYGSSGGYVSNRPAIEGNTQNYTFTLRGRDLVAVVNRASQDNRIIKGG